jgi:signal peptidase II
VAIALTVILLDQWSKFLAIKHLTPSLQQSHAVASGQDPAAASGEPLPDDVGFGSQLAYFYSNNQHPCQQPRARCNTIKVLDRLWHWKYAENPGAAWSFLANVGANIRVPFFLVVAMLAMVLIVWYFFRLDPSQKLLMVALALVLGGAAGNFIDRARLTYVIDFIVWYVGSYRWPTFNVADSAISVGVGMIFLDSLLDYLRMRRDQETGEASKPDKA